MNFTTLFDVAIAGVPLVLVIIGLVEWFKRLGLEGKPLIGVSMALGVILGGAYQITQSFPQSAPDWFAVVIIGLAYGLIASGIYDVVKNMIGKIEPKV